MSENSFNKKKYKNIRKKSIQKIKKKIVQQKRVTGLEPGTNRSEARDLDNWANAANRKFAVKN